MTDIQNLHQQLAEAEARTARLRQEAEREAVIREAERRDVQLERAREINANHAAEAERLEAEGRQRMREFADLVKADPLVMAYARAYASWRKKARRANLTESARSRLGDNRAVPEARFREVRFVDELIAVIERIASDEAEDYFEERYEWAEGNTDGPNPDLLVGQAGDPQD